MSWRRCQACFARSASLNIAKSLKLIPPWVFGLHGSYHLTQWIFRLSPFWPQKNLLIRDSIYWHKPNESLKQDIEYVGKAWATTLIRISQLAWNKSLPSHSCKFFHTHCLMLSKHSILFTTHKGWQIEIYFIVLYNGTPIASLINICMSCGVDLLKKSFFFLSIYFLPQCSHKSREFPVIFWHSLTFALQKIRLSFANNKWVSLGPLRQTETPVISLSAVAFSISPCRPSVHRRKR